MPGRTTFYLVSSKGRKYAFYVTPTETAYPSLALIDWSGDRQRILVQRTYSGSGGLNAVVEQISLTTGTVVSRFSLPPDVLPYSYTRPRGDSMLAVGLISRPSGILRYDLNGHLQRVLAQVPLFAGVLDSSRGSYVVAGTTTGLEQISNTGVILRRIRVPARVFACGPARWWTATTVLARCFGRGQYATDRLWLIPLGGGSPTALTPALRPHGLFLGYVNAWQLPSGLYLQADDAHDTLSIVRQFRDGSRHTVTVPGPAAISDWIVTDLAGRLLLQSNVGPGGPSSLFWFSPATRAIRFVFRAPRGVYGTAGVVPYGYRS